MPAEPLALRRRAPSLSRLVLLRFFGPGLAMLCLAWLPVASSEDAVRRMGLDSDGLCHQIGRAEVALPIPDSGDTLRLPHRLIAPQGFVLRQDSTVFRLGADYRLERLRGEIVWTAPRPAGSGMLVAVYSYFPLSVPGLWQRHAGEALPDTLRLRPITSEPARELPSGAKLEIGGSKTFTAEFGNRRDVGLRQSLDLTIRGQLTEQVRVRAVLTDRSTPFQAEGTTAELADLDQILVEVESPWGELRLGDIAVRQGGFLFLAHERQMEGLSAQARTRSGRAAAAAVGRAVGEDRTIQRFGEEGKQGPYRLLVQMPGEEAVIVAGTERVWLDGVRMKRGENADYVIDYGRGELRFMVRRPITSVSEMRVDFQVRHGAFDRGYYALNATSGDSQTGVAVAWMRERDDPEQSPLLALGDEERAALAEAGDSATAALAGGVAQVDPGAGDYQMVETDTLDSPFFVYVGPADPQDPQKPGGSYNVVFTDVGESFGDYDDSTGVEGETVYYYVGCKRGRFLPGRSIPLPESLDLIALRAGGRLGAGLSLSAEGAFSWNDLNVLSSKDDNDNAGRALRLHGDWQLGKLLGRREDVIGLRFAWRDVDEHFTSAEPLDPAFYYRRWNASSETVLNGKDRRGSAGLTCRPWKSVRFEGDWETIRSERGFRGERTHLLGERRGKLSLLGEIWRSESTEMGLPRCSEQQRAQIGWHGVITAAAAYRSEDLLSGEAGVEEGQGYQEGSLTAGFPGMIGGLNVLLTTRVRWDRTWQVGDADPAGRRRFYQAEVDYSRGPSQVQVTFARRLTDGVRNEGQQGTDLLDWVLAHRAPRGVLSAELRGRVTAEDARRRIGELIEVGTNAGHYDSLGNYEGQGDYEFYYVRSDSSELETRLESTARFTLRPFVKSAQGRSALRGLEARFYGRLEVATPERLGDLLADSGELFSGSSSCRSHDRLARCDFSWKGSSGAPWPRLRLEQREQRERSESDLCRRRSRELQEIEMRWTIRTGFTVRGQLGQEIDREGIEEQGGADDASHVDERKSRHAAAELTWKVLHPVTLRTGMDERRERFAAGISPFPGLCVPDPA